MSSREEKKPMELTPSKMRELERMAAAQPGLMTHPHHAGAFCIQPLNEDESRSSSLLAMQQQTQMQLNQIEEQVRTLTQQAMKLKHRFETSQKIYAAKVSFRPKIGQTYYLYRKDDQTLFLSMIHPDEWKACHTFLAAVELLADHTWHIHDDIKIP